MLALVVCFVIVGTAKSVLLLVSIHDAPNHPGLVTIDGLMAGGLASACLSFVLVGFRSRRRRILNYMKQVDSLNHHVRNALQAIVLRTETSEHLEELEVIRESVRRIDQTLQSAFPMVGDRKSDRAQTVRDLTE